MAMAVHQIRPLAHVPFILGVLRRLEGAPLVDGRIPLHPAPGGEAGHGGEALVRARLAGAHARDTVGPRLAERGMRALLQPGLPRAALPDDRFGHLLDALFAAKRHTVLRAVARKALAV